MRCVPYLFVNEIFRMKQIQVGHFGDFESDAVMPIYVFSAI